MKRIVSTAVLAIFLTHFVGFYAYFVVRQSQIREEMRALIGQMPDQDFETFVLSHDEYLRIRVNDHEVKINGQMYDHSAPKFEKGKVTLYAKHDEAEDNLIDFLRAVVKSASDDEKPVPSQLLSFLSLTFVTYHPLAVNPSFVFEKLNHPFSEKLHTRHLPVLSPPPKV